jgi:hypothetical protein
MTPRPRRTFGTTPSRLGRTQARSAHSDLFARVVGLVTDGFEHETVRIVPVDRVVVLVVLREEIRPADDLTPKFDHLGMYSTDLGARGHPERQVLHPRAAT